MGRCVNIDHVPFCDLCHSILNPPDKNNDLCCQYCTFKVASTLRRRKSVRDFDTEIKALMNKQIEKDLMAIDAENDGNSSKKKKWIRESKESTLWMDELESDKALRESLKKQMIGTEKKMIRQECLQCGAEEQAYEARQLRSVDEGQTLFFTCLECGNKTKLDS